MHKVIITIIIAVIGGVVGHYLKLPAGAMVGAMISVGAANILDVQPQLPETLNILGQIIIGAALGLSVTKEVLVGLKDYLSSVFACCYFISSVRSSYRLYSHQTYRC